MATERTRAYLDALWINFFTPFQIDYEDLFQSYYNILDDTAIEADAKAGTDNTKIITAQSARQSIQEGLGFMFMVASQAGNQYTAFPDYGAPLNGLSDDMVFTFLCPANSVGNDTIVFSTTAGLTGALPLGTGGFPFLGGVFTPVIAGQLVAGTAYQILIDTGSGHCFISDSYSGFKPATLTFSNEAQAAAGTDNTVIISPKSAKQAIQEGAFQLTIADNTAASSVFIGSNPNGLLDNLVGGNTFIVACTGQNSGVTPVLSIGAFGAFPLVRYDDTTSNYVTLLAGEIKVNTILYVVFNSAANVFAIISNNSNVVDLHSIQSIGGVKTLTDNLLTDQKIKAVSNSSNIKFNTALIQDSAAVDSIDWENRLAWSNQGGGIRSTIDWKNGILFDHTGLTNITKKMSIDWHNRTMFDNTAVKSVDYHFRMLIDNTGIASSAGWGNGIFTASLNFSTGAPSGSGSGVWRLGKKLAGVSVLDAANYVETLIDGVIVKLAIIV